MPLRMLLKRRCKQGKEDPQRLPERMGETTHPRPAGPLVWFHAASVGESQSTLILINALLAQNPALHIMVTTGTRTSAELMGKRLPDRAFHQYYPLDHPKWVKSFLDHWHPDAALWMESEIWPNMLQAIQNRNIPSAIVNARLSPRSFKRWKLAAGDIQNLLQTFSVCLTQTEDDAESFRALGADNVLMSGNLKYSATPLPYDQQDLAKFKAAINDRPCWLFASTHHAEEEMACRIHSHLQKKHPDLLTIIVPRHPDRREDIVKACEKYSLPMCLRGQNKTLPSEKDSIYIADTMGELGLFYNVSPIACIGRSFSSDGGGGHNPIEAAQFNCAILHGPLIQNLQQIYDDFDSAGAALFLKNEQDFQNRMERLFDDHDGLEALQNKAASFVEDRSNVLDIIIEALTPLLDFTNKEKEKCA